MMGSGFSVLHDFKILSVVATTAQGCSWMVWRTMCTQPSNLTPVITVPVYLQNKLKKIRAKQEKKDYQARLLKLRQGNRAIPVITCRRPEFNFYYGQTFDRNKPLPLATQGWTHRRSNKDYMTIHGFGKNPAILPVIDQDDGGFQAFGLHERVLDGIELLGYSRPTCIQELAIPKVLEGSNVSFSAETGSGKTIAYLAPVIDKILKHKLKSAVSPPQCPHTLILAPGKELAEQIGHVTKTIAACCGLSVQVLIGGQIGKKMQFERACKHDIDLLVSTLGALRKFVAAGIYDMSHVKHVVIDEADTMLDDSFNAPLEKFLHYIPFQEGGPPSQRSWLGGAQLVLVSATIPRNVKEVFRDLVNVDTLEQVATSSTHRVLPHVQQKFLRIAGVHKSGPLLEIVKTEAKNGRPVMVFSNKSSTCEWVSHFLTDNGVPNISLHADMSPHLRSGRFQKFQNGEVKVLSCTDIASRGLDTVQVAHIVNFNFPHHMSDYIHRVGRTGRVGSSIQGKVTSFVSNGYEAKLVQHIEEAVRLTKFLPKVDANIKKKIEDYAERMELCNI